MLKLLPVRLKITVLFNTARVSHYTVIQQPAVSNPVRSGDTAIFQCSVLFDSEKMPCSKDPNIFWFQAKSNNAYPNVIYTDTNRRDECEKRFDTEKSCLFQFSKVVSSSDAGIFYCAVASCGKLLIGNGTRLEIGEILSLMLLIKYIYDCIDYEQLFCFCCFYPEFEPEFSKSRWEVNNNQKFSSLTLLKASYSDDGLYHCALAAWKGNIEWRGTYWIVIGKELCFSKYLFLKFYLMDIIEL
uniref:Ig-like domain-containing protein n=1 Tax=Poecilia reticulata TaxID=8081 RepID=A0A3P9PHQ1_POERE